MRVVLSPLFGKKILLIMAHLPFLFASTHLSAAVPLQRYDFYIGDVNNDGLDDIYAESSIYVPLAHKGFSFVFPVPGDAFALIGHVDGSFSGAVPWVSGVDVAGFTVATTYSHDFDGDGEIDVFLHAGDAQTNSVLLSSTELLPEVSAQFSAIESLQISGNASVSVTNTYGAPGAEINIGNQYIAEFSAGGQFELRDIDIDNGATGGFYADALPGELVGVPGNKVGVSASGQSTHRIDIVVPPGIGGFEPKLSLAYSSGNPYGVAGTGWSLAGLPVISRCGQAPTFGDGSFKGVTLSDSDRLCLSGQRLKVVSGAYWQAGAIYKPETDASIKVTQAGEGGSAVFQVDHPDGKRHEFGHAFKASGDSALSWHLSEARDEFDNSISYEYVESGSESLLRYIRYGNFGDAVVEFRYERRDDGRLKYVAGVEVESSQALSAIRTWLSGDEVSEYRLIYGASPYDVATSGLTLKSVQRCGFELGARKCLPEEQVFSESQPFHLAQAVQGFSGVPAAFKSAVLDWNGDGVQDFASTDGNSITLKKLNSDGSAVDVVLVSSVSLDTIFSMAAVDIDQDGKDEIVYLRGSVDQLNWEGDWMVAGDGLSTSVLTSFSVSLDSGNAAVANERSTPEPSVVDVSRDGVPDLILFSGDSWKIITGGPVQSVLSVIPEAHMPLASSPFPVRLSGAGTTVLAYRDEAEYLSYLELSRAGQKVSSGQLRYLNSSGGQSSLPGNSIVPTDVNGDGLTDFVTKLNGFVTILFSQGEGPGQAFAREVTGTPADDIFFDVDSAAESGNKRRYYIRSADLNNDGLQDLFIFNPSNENPTSNQMNFLTMMSTGRSLSAPVDTGIRSYMRQKIAVFNYASETSNISSLFPYNTVDANQLDIPIFQGVVVDYYAGTVIGNVLALVSSCSSLTNCITLSSGQKMEYVPFSDYFGVGSVNGASATSIEDLKNFISSDVRDAVHADFKAWEIATSGGNTTAINFFFGGIPYPPSWPTPPEVSVNSGWPTDAVVEQIVEECRSFFPFPPDGCKRVFSGSSEHQALFVLFGFLEGYYDYTSNPEVYSQQSKSMPSMNDLQLLDVDGDGVRDLVTVNEGDDGWRVFINDAQKPLLSRVVDSLGAVQEIDYISALDGSVYSYGGVSPPSGAYRRNGGFDVVQSVRRDIGLKGSLGDPILSSESYSYADLAVRNDGRGFLGFASTRMEVAGDSVIEIQRSQQFPHIGMTLNKKSYALVGGVETLVSETESTLAELSIHSGAISQPYQSIETTEVHGLAGGLVSTVDKEAFYSVYDDSFAQLDKLTETTFRNGSEGLESVLSYSKDFVSYNHRSASWLMGFPTQITEKWIRPQETRQVVTDFTPYLDTLRLGSRTDFRDESYEIKTTFGYDSYGNVNSTSREAEVNGSLQNRTDSAEEAFVTGRYPAKLKNALGQTEQQSRQYNVGLGVLSRSTDINGLSTNYYYDPVGRLETTSRPDNTKVNATLHPCELEACDVAGVNAAYYRAETVTNLATNLKGAPTVYTYMDVLGREVAMETVAYNASEANILVTKAYNNLGLLVSESMPHRADESSPPATTYQYDELHRLKTQNTATGSVISIDRSVATGGGLITTQDVVVADQDGNTETRRNIAVTNVLGETVSTVDDASLPAEQRLDVTTTYSYDAQGNLASTKVDGRSDLETVKQFDTAGRLVSLDDPDTGTTTYVYNGFGELEKEAKANNAEIDPEYDLLGRMVSRLDTNPDASTATRSWVYDDDSNGQCDTSVTHFTGALACTFSPDFEEHYSYDSLGRVDTAITRIVGGSGQRVYTTSQTYDAFSRVDTQTWPNNFTAQWNYRSTGHLESVDNYQTNEELYRVDEMDVWGAESLVSLANGNIVVDSDRDAVAGRLISRQATSGTVAIQDEAYEWWTNGNLGERTVATESNGDLEELFGYDRMDRLTSALSSGAVTRSELFSYDRIGNIQSKYGVSGTYIYSVLQPHAVTSAGGISYEYDPAGNMTSRNGAAMVYNAFNKPVQIGGSSTSYFKYGADQDRIYQRATEAGTITETFYVRGSYEEVIITAGASTSVENRAYIGDFATFSAGALEDYRYLLRDHLGSISVVADEQGGSLEKAMYDPWGGVRTAQGGDNGAPLTESARGYTDHEHLASAGLIHMNGRLYDAGIGRFVSADPFVQAPRFSQSYNRYSYVMNKPTVSVDPSGYFMFSATDTGVSYDSDMDYSFLGNQYMISQSQVLHHVPGYDITMSVWDNVITQFSWWSANSSSIGDIREGAVDELNQTYGGYVGDVAVVGMEAVAAGPAEAAAATYFTGTRLAAWMSSKAGKIWSFLKSSRGARKLDDLPFEISDLKFTDAMSDKKFRDLYKSVRENGFEDPMIKYVDIDGMPYVVLGNNRVAAARYLGKVDELLFMKVDVPVPDTNFNTLTDIIDAVGTKRPPMLRGY